MKIIEEYEESHHYEREYIQGNHYCPACGSIGVFEEQGEGDYYLGADYICTECGYLFTMQGGSQAKDSIIDQLKSGITAIPTTKKGR